MFRVSVFLLSVFAAVSSFAAPSAPEPVPVEIISAEFGVFDTSDPRETLFEPTNVVPHREGQRYGWIIEVRSAKRSLSVREEYLLPNPVKEAKATDPVSANLAVPLQRHNQVSQRQLVPVDGKIYGEWAIGPSEPAGHRRLQIVIEDQVAASFEYDVK